MCMSDFRGSYLTSSYHNFEPYGVRTKKSLQKRNQIATYRHALPETLSFDIFFPSLIPTAPISTKFYLRRAVEIKFKGRGLAIDDNFGIYSESNFSNLTSDFLFLEIPLVLTGGWV